MEVLALEAPALARLVGAAHTALLTAILAHTQRTTVFTAHATPPPISVCAPLDGPEPSAITQLAATSDARMEASSTHLMGCCLIALSATALLAMEAMTVHNARRPVLMVVP